MGYVLFFVILFRRFVGVRFFVRGYLTGGKYRIVGRVRNLAQVISYEGVIVLGLLAIMVYRGRGRVILNLLPVLGGVLILFLVVAIVIERNRTPVDFVEGESELVSGLATEIGGLRFRLLFLIEYGVMGFYSVLLSMLVWGFMGRVCVRIFTAVAMIRFLGLLRLSLPRRRYDLNMLWGWKVRLVSVFL